MAAVPDLAGFGAALRLALGEKSRRWLAEQLGVSDQMVSNYFAGISEPERERVFQAERALGVPAGTLSRLLGYLPPNAVTPRSVPEAIEADPTLGLGDKRVLLSTYEAMLREDDPRRSGNNRH